MEFFSLIPKNVILPGFLQIPASLAWDESAAVLLCVLSVLAGGYFAFRYLAMKRALREMARDLREIQKDITQNQILHLPLPDRALEQVMESVNGTLEEVRRHRLIYEKREKEFQKQIENISHDLRTPLTVILGYLKWMKRDMAQAVPEPDTPRESLSRQAESSEIPGLDSAREILFRQAESLGTPGLDSAREILFRQAESLEILERNARAMERLVSQFYTFSQLNAQDYSLRMQDVDVCRLLRESLAEHWPALEKAHLRLNIFMPEHPVPIWGDAEGLERIFANMFQNAGRYACSYLDIRMEEAETGQVRILFRNDSEKIEEVDIPFLFERFYQYDNARNHGGSGLGLTIAKSLAEIMGGSLQACIVPEEQLQAPGPAPDTEAPQHGCSGHSLPDNSAADSGNEHGKNAAQSSRPDYEKTHILFILTLKSTPGTSGTLQTCPPESK